MAISSRAISVAKLAADSLSTDPSRVLALASDMSSVASETNGVKAVLDNFGLLDVLVANAGVGHFAAIDSLTGDYGKNTNDTNLTGVFNSVEASLHALKKSKGYIITISSLAGINFFENAAAYNASESGLVGFTQAIMLDLRK